ncbi:hypothetical protein TKK_0017911 [Trichogramma kaykai]
MREQFDLNNGKRIDKFLDSFIDSYKSGKGPYDFQQTFSNQELENLLKVSMFHPGADSFIEYVANSGYKDEPEPDEEGKLLVRRVTPLHYAPRSIFIDQLRDIVIRHLFKIYHRVDFEYIVDWKVTHLHVACMFGYKDFVEKFPSLEHRDLDRPPLGSDCEYQRRRVNAVDEWGRTPLLLAIGNNHKDIALLLLKRGADPNLAGTDGCTPLHLVCCLRDADDLTEALFQLKANVNATDNFGRTPLYYALIRGLKEVSERLLSLGAHPNLFNENGDCLLHLLCKRDRDSSDLAEMLFNFNNEKSHTIQKLDGRQTRVVINRRNKFEFNKLKTSMRINYDDQLVQKFFEMCTKKNKPVEIEAKNKLGRTALELAVAHLKPDVVDVLLDHGADLSGFVFPTESQFDKGLKSYTRRGIKFKLTLASSLLAICLSLVNRGYTLDQSDVSTIMKLFAKYKWFDKSSALEKPWCDDEEFTSKAKEIMVKPSLSFYDLIQLRPEEAEKLLTPRDYFEFSLRQWSFSEEINRACVARLCEQVSRGFFRNSASYPFQEIVQYRLPIEICEMIVERDVMNEDLYRICLAAATINLRRTFRVRKAPKRLLFNPAKRTYDFLSGSVTKRYNSK